MTGFGSVLEEADGLQVGVELRSVNHRYLKINTHLPEELGWAQGLVDARVRDRCSRGAVTATMSVEHALGDPGLEIDVAWLRKLCTELVDVRRELAPEEHLGLGSLLAVEGVVRPRHTAPFQVEEGRRLLERAVTKALDDLVAMQVREGENLVEELRGIVRSLEQGLEIVEAGLPAATVKMRERYVNRVQGFLAGTGVELEANDVVREIAILAEKSDITEELGRMRSHAAQFVEVLDAGGRVGRKLDFLTQEMFREANTMGAKVAVSELAHAVMDLKGAVDRLREQVQNLE